MERRARRRLRSLVRLGARAGVRRPGTPRCAAAHGDADDARRARHPGHRTGGRLHRARDLDRGVRPAHRGDPLAAVLPVRRVRARPDVLATCDDTERAPPRGARPPRRGPRAGCGVVERRGAGLDLAARHRGLAGPRPGPHVRGARGVRRRRRDQPSGRIAAVPAAGPAAGGPADLLPVRSRRAGGAGGGRDDLDHLLDPRLRHRFMAPRRLRAAAPARARARPGASPPRADRHGDPGRPRAGRRRGRRPAGLRRPRRGQPLGGGPGVDQHPGGRPGGPGDRCPRAPLGAGGGRGNGARRPHARGVVPCSGRRLGGLGPRRRRLRTRAVGKPALRARRRVHPGC